MKRDGGRVIERGDGGDGDGERCGPPTCGDRVSSTRDASNFSTGPAVQTSRTNIRPSQWSRLRKKNSRFATTFQSREGDLKACVCRLVRAAVQHKATPSQTTPNKRTEKKFHRPCQSTTPWTHTHRGSALRSCRACAASPVASLSPALHQRSRSGRRPRSPARRGRGRGEKCGARSPARRCRGGGEAHEGYTPRGRGRV